jgi:hypothetical protein
MNAKRLEEKDPGETVPLSWDFTDDIADIGDFTITTATIEVSVDRSLSRGTDPTPSALLNSSPQIDGFVVAQSITGGLDGVDYKVTCKAQIDSTPVSTIYKTSILPVRTQ